MIFKRYNNLDSFSERVFRPLMKYEVENNIILGLLTNKTDEVKNWLLSTVEDEEGGIKLIATCTPPHNLVLFEPDHVQCDEALRVLSDNVRQTDIDFSGVLAAEDLALRFAEIHAPGSYEVRSKMIIMKLDEVNGDLTYGKDKLRQPPGYSRLLEESDLSFLPYWREHFSIDCGMGATDISFEAEDLRKRFLGKDTCYIWVDVMPVSTAAQVRALPNGAVIANVYTPPFFREKGYAKACVAYLAKELLSRGNLYCALYADMENPISCGIYHKIGFQDQCISYEIKFK